MRFIAFDEVCGITCVVRMIITIQNVDPEKGRVVHKAFLEKIFFS
jgi:hypothetical protein